MVTLHGGGFGAIAEDAEVLTVRNETMVWLGRREPVAAKFEAQGGELILTAENPAGRVAPARLWLRGA